MSETNLPAPVLQIPDDRAAIDKLVKRARRGDESAMRQLHQFMDQPQGKKFFLDLTGRIRNALVRKFSGDDRLAGELTMREMKALQSELLGPTSTAIERLLADRVAIGWLEVQTAEYNLTVRPSDYHDYWQQQVNHAHRRFLSALRLLTAVRRLPRPAMQVNIAEQQVNVSG